MQCSRIFPKSLSEFDANKIEENLRRVELPLVNDEFQYILQIQPSTLYSCPRCRLQTSENENQLCSRCSSRLQKS